MTAAAGAAVTAERRLLLHHERLLGLAHLAVVPLAGFAAFVQLDDTARAPTGLGAVLLGTLAFGGAYHFALPRLWLSRAKVLLGLCIDAALVTEVVRLTGWHMSLLVFLYYLVVIATGLTLGTRALAAMCALISVLFTAMLPFDPVFDAAPRAHAGHVVLFVVSVWLVGGLVAAGAKQIRGVERRLLDSLRAQESIARENATLSADLGRRLEESRALAVSLERHRQETRRLADMVIRAQEDERGRVARELHDEANQTLAALMTTVDHAETAAARSGSDELVDTLGRLRRLASSALGDLQRIAVELRPPALDEFGLIPALGRHVRDRTAGTPLHAEVVVEGRRRRLPPAVEVALYRIAQEALANVQKHAEAGSVTVRLAFLPRAVRLDVVDDGAGFDQAAPPAAARERLGVLGMRERASIVGGEVVVSSRPGGGTRVTAAVPVGPVGVEGGDAAAVGAAGQGRAAS